MATMDSVALSPRSSSRKPASSLRNVWFNCLLAMAALGLAVALWHLSSSPRQVAAANRPLFEAAGDGHPGRIGDLVRWRGQDGVDRLLVANNRHDAVVAYAADSGEPLMVTPAGQFEGIAHLALHDNLLWVTDQGGRRVQVLALPGLQPYAPSSAQRMTAAAGTH